MRQAAKTIVLALLASALLSLPAAAQKTATDEVGFNAGKLYDFHDIDSVNLFNGNLTVTLPLGHRYQVSSALSYQLVLIYNGKHYDIETYDCEDTFGNPDICMDGVPARQSNAGWSWRVSLGRLLPPHDVTANNSSFDRHDFIYEGPAGDEHTFGASDDDASIILSKDPQPLRLRKIGGLSLPTREVEFPNGEVHRFQEEQSAWRLKQMRDRFGNWVNIAYAYASIDGKQRETQWTITDGVGRSHTVSFIHHSALHETWSLGQSIGEIVLDGFGGADNTYKFTYTTCGAYPVLQSVSLPVATSLPYAFEYHAQGCELSKVTLPTRGSVSYTYEDYYFASETEVCANGPFGSAVRTDGIQTRTVSDGVTSHTWEYVQRRGPKVTVDYANPDPCWPDEEYGPFYWSRTSVLAPLDANGQRARTDHYFSIFGEPPYPDMEAHPFPAANDLPFGYAGVAGRPPDARAKGPVTDIPEETAGYPADVSGSDGSVDKRYLSSRVYAECDAAGDCTDGELLRSTYVKHACLGEGTSFNLNQCWAVTTRTVYEDDAGCGSACYTQETSSDRTGGGLYRTVTTASNFPAPGTSCTAAEPCAEAQTGKMHTEYPSWPAAEQLDATKAWITGTFTEQQRTEGSATSSTRYRFSSSTGALEAVRVLEGTALGGDDVLTIFGRDTKGNVTREASYGGDGANLSTAACCDTPAAGLQYLVRKKYDADNFLTKSEYLEPGDSCTEGTETACVSILTTADVAVDQWTGRVTSARDSAEVQTTYDYDDTGRLTAITPTGAASRTYAYTAATATANAQAVESVKDAAETTLATSTFEFDGLGRVKRVSTPLPDSKLATTQTDYDQRGAKRRVSQPVERTAHPTTNVGSNWTTTTSDALGRPTAVAGPDGSSTTFAYTGARRMERTSSVATSTTGSTAATTVEHYDALGRLRKVEEAAGDTSATATTGTTVTTDYTYDVAGRLTSVSDATPVQPDRVFTYDGRGYLTKETHPENGDTTYSGYDARGNAGTRTSGGKTLKFDFDAAGRIVYVAQDVAGTEKPLKVFSYATASTETNLQKGKLVTAIRHNERTAAGTIEVKETYTYEGSGGQMSTRNTVVDRVVNGTRTKLQEFAYGVTHDDFLLPKTLTMPTCSANGCSTSAGLTSVSYERSSGHLTSVPDFASLTYHPSGMVKTVQHASSPSATDTYSVTSGIARPSSITFSGGSPACPVITPSTIAAPGSVCPQSAGSSASVTARAGITHTWTISGGGTITSGTTGESITFTAPPAGVVTLTVTATDTCGESAPSSKDIAVQDGPAAPPIAAPASVCGGSSGNAASVAAQSGITHTWSISGGTITSSATGEAIAFTAGTSGSVTLTATATDGCGSAASAAISIAITPTPTADLSGGTTIVRGASTRLHATLTGSSPWRLEWSDGHVQSNVTSSTTWHDVTPDASTSYDVSVSSGVCSGTSSGPVTVTVIPPAPASVSATTQTDRNVLVTWSAVAGASGYRIERAPRRDAAATWVTTVGGTVTSLADVVPATTQPTTYVYYVRTIDTHGELSERGAWDHATAATVLYLQPNIVPGVTMVKGTDVGELRGGIDALRYAVWLPAAFGGSVAPTGLIRAADFAALVTALNEARAAAGIPAFAWSGVPAPASGGTIVAAHIQQLREALR